jgi:hypothetical protein
MRSKQPIIAACGLVCSDCDILRASTDPEAARRVVDWFKRERGLDLALEDIGCAGCTGDRAEVWSPDCWIWQSCVDQKELENCSQCGDFPCERLQEWAKTGKEYREALSRLRDMRGE